MERGWNPSLKVKVLVTQSCPTMCNLMDCPSPPGSSVHGIPQARILEWVAIYFSRGSSQPRNQTQVSYIAGGVFTTWITRDSPFTFTSLNHSKILILSFTCSWGLDYLMVSFLAKPLNCIRCLLKNAIDHLKPPQNYPKFHRGIFYISLNVKTNGKAEEI